MKHAKLLFKKSWGVEDPLVIFIFITYNGKHDKILIKQTRFVLPPDPCIVYLSVQNEQSCGNWQEWRRMDIYLYAGKIKIEKFPFKNLFFQVTVQYGENKTISRLTDEQY